MAQDEVSQQYAIHRFTGYNQSSHSQFLSTGETQNAQNMDIRDGNLNTCKGYKKFVNQNQALILGSETETGIKSLMPFYTNNDDGTVSSYLLAATESAIYKLDMANYKLSDGPGWQSIKTGLTNGYFEYINYQKNDTDLIIMTNGVDNVLKYDGTTVANLGGTPPKFSSLALHYERVWGTGISTEPNSVYYSDDLNPEVWTQTLTTGGLIDMPTWDGSKCIAVMSIFDNIVVFKEKNIFKIYGSYPGEYEKKTIYTSIGAIAKRSIANAVTMAFFLAEDGIYVYEGTETQLISTPIKNIIDNLTKDVIDKAVGIFHDGKYILAVPVGQDATENNTIIEYDVLNKTFNIRTGISVNSFVKYDDTLIFTNGKKRVSSTFTDESGNPVKIYVCDVYEYDTGTTLDGEKIEAFWGTPNTDWDAPNATKTSTYLYGTFQGEGQIKIDATFDGTTKSITIDLPSTPTVIKKRLRNKGRRFNFKFSNVDGSSFTLINPKILMDVDED